MSFEKITELALKSLAQLQTVAYSSIFKLVVLLLVIGGAYTAWEFREAGWKQVSAQNKITIGQLPNPPSKTTQDEIIAMVKQSDIIGAAQLVNVNFLTNTRAVVFTNSDDDTITYELREFYRNRTAATPFFFPKDAPGAVDNNWRSVAIINGEWKCEKFETTVGARNLPKLVGRIAQLCSVSIPPWEGYFSGYIVVWLLADPSPLNAENIQRKVRSVARALWEREFNR